ncbi:MAG: ribosome recycling factor [Patescibacteria group bacterium]
MDIINDYKPEFEKVLEHLHHEINTLRTGRASPALVEDLPVEAYGAMQPVKALGSMSTPDARTLVIEPWDSSVVKAIESAIIASGIGISPVVDGKIIRLIMPMMTEENRLKMVKVMHGFMEDGRVKLRKVREEAKKKIEKQTGIGQDDIRNQLEALDKLVKDFVSKIDDMGDKKEKEIMTV